MSLTSRDAHRSLIAISLAVSALCGSPYICLAQAASVTRDVVASELPSVSQVAPSVFTGVISKSLVPDIPRHTSFPYAEGGLATLLSGEPEKASWGTCILVGLVGGGIAILATKDQPNRAVLIGLGFVGPFVLCKLIGI